MKIIGMILLIIVVLFCAFLVYACLCASHEAGEFEEMCENAKLKVNNKNKKQKSLDN